MAKINHIFTTIARDPEGQDWQQETTTIGNSGEILKSFIFQNKKDLAIEVEHEQRQSSNQAHKIHTITTTTEKENKQNHKHMQQIAAPVKA